MINRVTQTENRVANSERESTMSDRVIHLFNRVTSTDSRPAPVVLRVALAAVIFPHGAQKALGWFGGTGLEGTIGFFSGQLGIPAALALLVIAAEFLGSIGLVAGFLTRAAAAGIAAVMVGAVALVHGSQGFFMDWSGTQGGEGFEFHVLALGIAVALMITGGGAASLDRLLSQRVMVQAAERGRAQRPERPVPAGKRHAGVR